MKINKTNTKITKILIYIVLLVLLFPQPAQAYLDPGTGSYLFQMLMAGVLGTLFFIKSIIRKVKEFFSKLFSERSVDEKENKDRKK